ncbi:FAD/NAD(P)-binding protein [Methylobacterium sp. J-090]|uniref:FAD/NAD(P)-binding protein n=1 Tax=Methylobacterium sp. J-090 TaxID=2836666 RepID=UPI001FBB13CE|nr:FAD/NAD(P)-binding protein [Methylobacterium sp. J-090]MCJ2082781.1 FAD/NAD(P)-binding protein [Methylobacterium sp. J-090]
MRPVAVIGAGFSGTMSAIQLLARLEPERRVLLCERAGTFGRGRAYATGNPDHLLNVRAANMSAYPDRPEHFSEWLAATAFDGAEAAGIRVTPGGTFAARGLYGRYLTELLTRAVTGGDGPPRLDLVNDAVTDLEPVPGGYTLRTEGGASYPIAGAVLAMGNLGSPEAPRSRHQADPWSPGSFGRLHPDRTVLIVGTGLTMVDAVAALRRHGFSGRIVALSRRGLLPSAHAPARPWPMPDLAGVTTLPALVARIRDEIVRAEAGGSGWRGVIDALRPVTDALWRDLPAPERARFLRHLRPFWDVHRHRTAPPAAEAIADEIARGTLVVRAGRIRSVADTADAAVVTLRPRGSAGDERLPVQCILDATGIGRVAETDDPFIRRLMGRGLVRPGPFGIGLDAAPDLRALTPGALGPAEAAPLWVVGPLLRGVLWECTAVPDIRNQAAGLAGAVAQALSGTDRGAIPD